MAATKTSKRSTKSSADSKAKPKRASSRQEPAAAEAVTDTTSSQEAESLATSEPSTISDLKGEKTMSAESPLTNGIKVVGEACVLPGSSLLMDGQIKDGTMHMVGGVASKVLLGSFGAIGWGLFAADSYSLSVTGKHIHQHFYSGKTPAEGEATTAS